MNNGRQGQGTHCTKIDFDNLAESAPNFPNGPEFICPICLPKPKRSGFQRRAWYVLKVVLDKKEKR